jgi:hypothetical protein
MIRFLLLRDHENNVGSRQWRKKLIMKFAIEFSAKGFFRNFCFSSNLSKLLHQFSLYLSRV